MTVKLITITKNGDDSEDDDEVLELVLAQCPVLITGDFYVSCGNSIVWIFDLISFSSPIQM